MSNREFWQWESSCGRKVRYSRRSLALRCIQRIASAGGGYKLESFVTYRCRFCGGYHLGHLNGSGF